VPVLVDQPFWADRVHRLGVAPRPLPLHELTADTLTAALRSCLDGPTYRDRATALAHRIRADDGPAGVLALITQLGHEHRGATSEHGDGTGWDPGRHAQPSPGAGGTGD
jgi:UDP:flavonoid glycosyltransferase YjiC (YdhE family)